MCFVERDRKSFFCCCCRYWRLTFFYFLFVYMCTICMIMYKKKTKIIIIIHSTFTTSVDQHSYRYRNSLIRKPTKKFLLQFDLWDSFGAQLIHYRIGWSCGSLIIIIITYDFFLALDHLCMLTLLHY